MQRHPNRYGFWNYETGTVLKGFEDLWKYSGEIQYYNYLKSTVDFVVQPSGVILGYNKGEYNLDQIKEGCSLLFLYNQTSDNRYKIAADSLRSQLKTHPRNPEGGFWHKLIYPNEMWLDGLYMAEPFYCQYGEMFNEPEDFDDVALQLKLMEKHSRDENTGLLYHGWDEDKTASWANPVTGRSPVFWGRSIGWYAMALVDVLDHFPEENAERDSIIEIFKRLAVAVKNYQDPESHVWWQVVDSIDGTGNWKESSGSCMFVYALAKGVRMHYIDSSYLSVVKTGYNGLLNEFVTYNSDGTLNLINTCEGTGVGGSYFFYINRGKRTNDPKGVGPFVMASVEMEKTGLLIVPDNLMLDSINENAAFLSWHDNSVNEEGFILEKDDGDGFTLLAKTDSNITSYNDSSISAGTLRRYRIKAFNSEDTTIWSNTLSVTAIPIPATDFLPADNSTDVSVNVVLTWHPGKIVNIHKVYFGKTNPPAFVKNSSDTIYNPGTLSKGTIYYWRIDEVNENHTTKGQTLSFKTEGEPNDINTTDINGVPVSIFPVPARNYLLIKLNESSVHEVEITVLDPDGNTIITKKADNKYMFLNTESLADGTYILKVTDIRKNIVIVKKFVKTE